MLAQLACCFLSTRSAMYTEVRSTEQRQALAQGFPPAMRTCTWEYLVLGNCTWPSQSLRPSTEYLAGFQELHLQRQTQQVCIMRRLPFPPPPNLQPFQHPCAARRRRRFSPFAAPTCPAARADWPQALEEFLPAVSLSAVCTCRALVSGTCRACLRTSSRVSASGRNLPPKWGLAQRLWQGIASISSLLPPACLARVASLLPPRDPTLSLSASPSLSAT